MIFLPCWIMLIFGVSRIRRPRDESMRNDPSVFIVQVTTNGNASDSVNNILGEIAGYNLGFPHHSWVVTEEGDESQYNADRVLRVPSDYATPNKTRYKARALCYSSDVRGRENLCNPETKIMFLDDDSVPTKEYIEYAYHCNFDIAQGVIAPRRDYGHSLLPSIQDNARTSDCLAFCSHFNSKGNAMIVHGEGLLVRGHVEKDVGWDFGDCIAEDLVFGRKATKKYLFGFIPEYIEIVPPKSIRDFMIQRRRWFWGHISALKHLDLTQRVFIAVRYAAAFLGAISYYFVIYDQITHIDFDVLPRLFFMVNTLGWMAYYAIGSYYNTGKKEEVFKAVVLAFPAAYLESCALFFSLFTRPKGFEVIAK
jgi:cellulose synthase/poly-beta-1,6-N-acetylglucosamine synthase-like glycosyltransferase